MSTPPSPTGLGPRDTAADVDDWDRHWCDYATAVEHNPAQVYRQALALGLLERRGIPERLLDIGSGLGELLLAASGRWPQSELRGVDISAEGVAVCRRKVPHAAFHVANLAEEPEAPVEAAGWATHAVCSEVLEHVDDPVHLMRNARSWLAPGCRVVVTVPGGPISAFDRHIGHRTHFTPASLREVLQAAGYEPRLCSGAGFPFFNVYRAVVIARGRKLVDDVAAGGEGEDLSATARVAMAVFGHLFRLNLPSTRFGWQTIGVATVPAAE